MASTLLLVHSPLVGPSSWRPMRDIAREAGRRVICPDLTTVAGASAPQWRHLVQLATEAVVGCEDVVVVGHSGAGVVLPEIGARLEGRLRAPVFVDAVVPPPTGEHRSSPELIDLLDARSVDGWLPQWLDWWPEEVVTTLVPSPTDRAELRDDMPRLARSFYDGPVPVPDGWTNGPCTFVQLSAAYDVEYRDAQTLGWPTASLDGNHLSIFTDPVKVWTTIDDLASRW